MAPIENDLPLWPQVANDRKKCNFTIEASSMRNLFLFFGLFICFQSLQAQIIIFAGQGLNRQKVGFCEKEVVFGIDKDEKIISRGNIRTGKDSRIEILAPNETLLGYLEWNNETNGASTIYDENGKKLGFVSFSNGIPFVYSLKTGMPSLIGSADAGSTPLDPSNARTTAAAAALLLLFDWC